MAEKMKNKILQINLMFGEAKCRLEDAETLETRTSTTSDSGYLLRLLAFEILLKSVLLIHDQEPTHSHNYKALFKNLPDKIQGRIFKEAGNRNASHADYSTPDNLLNTFEKNFINFRYPYEKYKDCDEDAYFQKGEEWIKKGAPNEEATFVYNPEELFGLTFALQQEIENWLKMKE